MFTGALFQTKLDFLSIVLLSSPAALKTTKAVPGKFHKAGRSSKHNCLQDWANFHRSLPQQIVLILNTGMVKSNIRMTSWNESPFRIIGPLCREFPGDQ